MNDQLEVLNYVKKACVLINTATKLMDNRQLNADDALYNSLAPANEILYHILTKAGVEIG